MQLPYLTLALSLLIGALAMADPSMNDSMTENIEYKKSLDIVRMMKERGWSTDGLATMELGAMTVLQRDGNYVGYCVIESEQRPRSPEEYPLSGVTKIQYGDPYIPSDKRMWFTVDNPKEIALWVAACRNHARSTHKILRFIALTADAGFENSSIDLGVQGYGHGCHMGLYFYNADNEEVLALGGHLDEASKPGQPSSNEVLQALVWDRIQKERAKRKANDIEETNQSNSKPLPNPTQPKVEQGADGKTTQAPQLPH